MFEWTADEKYQGVRLDKVLSEVMDVSRSQIGKWFDEGRILINGKTADKKSLPTVGDTVTVDLPDTVPDDAQPQNIPLDIVYEDENLLVVNKPKGMVVHPAPGNPDGTLVNALLYHCQGSLSGIGGVERPGIVHRIDKETSGLLVVAKNDDTHLYLSELLKTHDVSRVYYAIVLGNIKEEDGTVDAPIGRHPVNRQKMAVIRDDTLKSRDAVTHYHVLAHGEGDGMPFTLVRCALETGRTHQIRVHMASIGHPLLGDTLYGGDKTSFEKHHPKMIDGQCLHAGQLRFIYPHTNEVKRFVSPLPDDFKKLMKLLFDGYDFKEV